MMTEKLKIIFSRIHFSSENKNIKLIYVGCFLVCFLIYVVLAKGFDSISSAQSDLADKQNLYVWMEVNAPLVKSIQKQKNALPELSQNSLGAIESSLKSKHLDEYVQKSEELQDQKIHVLFKQVPFDTLIQWLAQLRQSVSLTVSKLSAQGSEQQGTVDAELVLSMPGAPSKN